MSRPRAAIEKVDLLREYSAYLLQWMWEAERVDPGAGPRHLAYSKGASDDVAARIRRIFAAQAEGGLPPPAPPAAPAAPGYLLHPDAMPPPGAPYCIMGVIDDLPPLLDRRFTANGRTRFAALRRAEGPFSRSAQTLTGAEIDAARARFGRDAEGAMRHLGLWDAARGPRRCGGCVIGHGAAVAHLMAAVDPGRHPEAARRRPIVAAALAPEAIREVSGVFAPLAVLEAATFVVEQAAALAGAVPGGIERPPLVLNLSYGVSAGALDGSDLVARLLSDLARDAVRDPRLARARARLGEVRVAVAMGNHRAARLHATLPPGGTVPWRVPPGDASTNFVEIWGPEGRVPQVEIGAPDGTAFASADMGGPGCVATVPPTGTGPHLLRAYALQAQGAATGGLIVAVPPTEAPIGRPKVPTRGAGTWTITSTDGAPLAVRVQRDDGVPGYGAPRRQSSVARRDTAHDGGRYVPAATLGPGPDDDPRDPATERGTMSPFATGGATHSVGALSGEGPARYSGVDPDGGAGRRVARADRSRAERGLSLPGTVPGATQRMSGTSIAAPQVARALAAGLAPADGAADLAPQRPDW